MDARGGLKLLNYSPPTEAFDGVPPKSYGGGIIIKFLNYLIIESFV